MIHRDKQEHQEGTRKMKDEIGEKCRVLDGDMTTNHTTGCLSTCGRRIPGASRTEQRKSISRMGNSLMRLIRNWKYGHNTAAEISTATK